MAYILLVLGFAVLWIANYVVLANMLKICQESDLYINASLTWDWSSGGGRESFLKGWRFQAAFVGFLTNELLANALTIAQGEGARWWMPLPLLGATLLAMASWYVGDPQKPQARRAKAPGKGESDRVDDTRPFRFLLPRAYVPGALVGLLVSMLIGLTL